MRRALLAVLSAALLFSANACGGSDDEPSKSEK